MMRKDFKHFIKIISEELPENFALQTHKTDKGYVAPYAKIRELHSTITEFHSNDVNYKYKGIYIDVFLWKGVVRSLHVLLILCIHIYIKFLMSVAGR